LFSKLVADEARKQIVCIGMWTWHEMP